MPNIRGTRPRVGCGHSWRALHLVLLPFGLCTSVSLVVYPILAEYLANAGCQVGMLACNLDVKITFDKSLTVLSAAVAVLFTFAAFCSGYATEAIENSPPVLAIAKFVESLREAFRSILHGRPQPDLESAGYTRVAESENGDDEDPESTSNGTSRREEEEDEEEERAQRGLRFPDGTQRSAWPGRHDYDPIEGHEGQVRAPTTESVHFPSNSSTTLRSVRHSSPPPPKRHSSETTDSGRASEDTSPLTTSSDEDSTFAPNPSHRGRFGPQLATRTWSDPLHAGLSREARLRIKARTRDKPVPEFGWKYWLKRHYSSISLLVIMRAAIWGVAIVFMHYCGMWAMQIPEGRIQWDLGVVAVSYMVAFGVCFVGCIAMVHMEVHFGRQVVFSTIASIGTCSMHYTGTFMAIISCLALISSRDACCDLLHASLALSGRRIPRLSTVYDSSSCRFRLCHLQCCPRTQCDHLTEPNGRSDSDQATFLARHGGERSS